MTGTIQLGDVDSVTIVISMFNLLSYIRRKLSTGRQPIVNRVAARKATDWSKFCREFNWPVFGVRMHKKSSNDRDL